MAYSWPLRVLRTICTTACPAQHRVYLSPSTRHPCPSGIVLHCVFLLANWLCFIGMQHIAVLHVQALYHCSCAGSHTSLQALIVSVC